MKTALVLVGAHSFPKLETIKSRKSLLTSSRLFLEYVRKHKTDLGVRDEWIIDLFDSKLDPHKQLQSIQEGLSVFISDTKGEKQRNVIFHYVGHGMLTADRTFGLAVASTETDKIFTAIRFADIKGILSTIAQFSRKFLIIDCCFAAAALKDFLPGDSTTAASNMVENQISAAFHTEEPSNPKVNMPSRGTAALFAADKDSVAVAPDGWETTVFSGALLRALDDRENGHPMTLHELKTHVWQTISDLDLRFRVLPVLMSPEQVEGDIADSVELFPTTNGELADTFAALTKSKNEALRIRWPKLRRKHQVAIALALLASAGIVAYLGTSMVAADDEITAPFSEKGKGPVFLKPTLNGYTIDGCISSPRFPESSAMQCIQAAQRQVADRYCLAVGYPHASSWNFQDTGVLQQSVKLYVTERRPLPSRYSWLVRPGGAILTKVDCEG